MCAHTSKAAPAPNLFPPHILYQFPITVPLSYQLTPTISVSLGPRVENVRHFVMPKKKSKRNQVKPKVIFILEYLSSFFVA